jgi:hypothetical protein
MGAVTLRAVQKDAAAEAGVDAAAAAAVLPQRP